MVILKYPKFESVGLPARSSDDMSSNVRKPTVFGVVLYGTAVNFTYWEINVTWIVIKKHRFQVVAACLILAWSLVGACFVLYNSVSLELKYTKSKESKND